MARRSRSIHPGGWYHVFNRGVAQRSVFESRADRRFFLSLVARQVRAGRIRLHAYCLMTNHYHLLVELPGAELPLAMREIGRHYTRWFNSRRDRDGPLFRARYASRYLEDERYRVTVLRYIDRNPVVGRDGARVAAYPWGSARDFNECRERPWLDSCWVSDVVKRATGASTLGPGDYGRYRNSEAMDDSHLSELVEARLHSSAHDARGEQGNRGVPLSDMMQSRALEADGNQAILPLASAGAVLESIEEQRKAVGEWRLIPMQRAVCGWRILATALLRHVVGMSIREIAARMSCSRSTIERDLLYHRALLSEEPTYVQRLQAVLLVAEPE